MKYDNTPYLNRTARIEDQAGNPKCLQGWSEVAPGWPRVLHTVCSKRPGVVVFSGHRVLCGILLALCPTETDGPPHSCYTVTKMAGTKPLQPFEVLSD